MATYQVETDGGTYQVETEAQPGKMESFARGAANNFPLAPQAIAGAESLTGIGDEGGYSKNLADWNQKAQEAKSANPNTYKVGAAIGTIAPLIIPAVGEALEAAPFAANAAMGAAQAISNKDLSKDYAGTAKDVLKGGLIGGTIGKGAQALGAAASGVSKMFEPAANRLEANATATALDINPRALFKMSRGGNPEEAALNINKNLNELLPNTIGLNDTAASKFQKLSNAHDAAGNMIGNVIKSTSKNIGTGMPEIDNAISKLNEAASKYKGMQFEDSLQSKAILDDTAKMLNTMKKNGTLNFQNLSQLKQEIGQIYHNPNNVVQGVDQTYSILSDSIDKILDRVSVESPEIKPQYDQAKKIFKFTSDVLPAMGRGVAREVAGKSGGLTNAALGVGALFHPGAAGLAYAAKTAAHLAAPELGPNLAYKTINALRNGAGIPNAVGKIPSQELINFLTSKYGKKNEIGDHAQ